MAATSAGCLAAPVTRSYSSRRGSHLEAINHSGLRVESDAAGTFEVQASAMERPDGSWKADLILYCVKGYDNHTGVPTIGPAVGR